MAYDEELAERIGVLLDPVDGVTEKRMFGGLAFLVDGRMAVAVSGNGGLMVRVDPRELDAFLQQPQVSPMIMRGREMKGWLRVAADGIDTDERLGDWVRRGVAVAQSLLPKE